MLSFSKKSKNKFNKTTKSKSSLRKRLNLADFVSRRDYEGALALLEFNLKSGAATALTNWWIGYCAFHLGRYQRAVEAYEEQSRIYEEAKDEEHFGDTDKKENSDGDEQKSKKEDLGGEMAELDKSARLKLLQLCIACCKFYLGDYQESLRATEDSLDGPLKIRLLFHLSQRMDDDNDLMHYHQKLGHDTMEDQLSLAAMHFVRSHFQEATEVYKRLLIMFRNDVAINVYVAMCYYKLDYYDVSLEILQAYLSRFPASTVAVNLKACNHFKLYNGKAAESEVKVLADQGVSYENQELIRHNLVVFRNGENALQVSVSFGLHVHTWAFFDNPKSVANEPDE